MKEIRAFIRQHRIADVLQALRESGLCDLGTAGAGCHNITVSQVQRPARTRRPTHWSMSSPVRGTPGRPRRGGSS
mgnify:CR=1 FL=1